MTTTRLARRIKYLVNHTDQWAAVAAKTPLRPYQAPPLAAIIHSIRHRLGLQFVIVFPRQSGKNELQAILFTYLLFAYQRSGGNIVTVSPTYKPQTIIAMQRIEAHLTRNILTRHHWRKQAGFIYRLGAASLTCYSGDKNANVMGATASLLLSVDEAQDIPPQKYDRDFAPMAASTNATRVFWGTRWTDESLLERELNAALQAQQSDGIQRVFLVNADDVAQAVPAYGRFVAAEIARLGRNHPIIKTQYFCEPLKTRAGMFPPQRLALMRGTHPPQDAPTPGAIYAFLIDVAGQDENPDAPSPSRDATALTIVEVDLTTLNDLAAPTYRTVHRRQWIGRPMVAVFGQLAALIDAWNPDHIVIDATGLGEGLASLLTARFGDRVIWHKWSAASKSAAAWQFIAIIETGRYREYHPFDDLYRLQLQKTRFEALPGPNKRIRWGVPETARDASGRPVHDDLVLAAALIVRLDELDWTVPMPTTIIPPAGDR